MIKEIDLQDDEQATELLLLEKAAYRVEADLIGYDDIPPLKDTLATLQSCGEIFYGYYLSGKLAGALSYKLIGPNDNIVDIHRVVVHPDYFRRGIGRALLGFIEGVRPGLSKLVVSAARDNTPAIRLYHSQGYIFFSATEIAPGVFIHLLQKRLRPFQG